MVAMMWWVASTEWLHRAWSTTAWRSARSCRFVFDTVCILREIRRFVGHCDPEARALAVRSCFTDDVMSVRACTWVGCRAISRTWLQPAGSLRNERPSAAGAAGCVYERKSATTRPRNRTIAAHVDCDPALGVHPPDVGVHLKGSCCARVPRARIRREPKAPWRPSRPPGGPPAGKRTRPGNRAKSGEIRTTSGVSQGAPPVDHPKSRNRTPWPPAPRRPCARGPIDASRC
jgi:hypothetical protein